MNSTTSIIDNLVEQCVPKEIDQFLNKTSTKNESMKSFQTTINDNNNNEILPNDLDENTNTPDDQINLKSSIEQLKIHIDLLYRQLNLQRNGVQMFNRFVQRNAPKNTFKHYERFRRNYCYWNKKCRRLSKHQQQQQQIKTSPYDILHRLYVNLPEQQPKNTSSSNSDEITEANLPEICITKKDIEISLTTPETKTNTTTKIAYYFCSILDCGEIFSDKETLISHLQGHKLFDIKVLDRNSSIVNKADEEEESIKLLAEKKQQSNQIELNHQCFVRSCSKRFSAKEDFLNHLFQHSIITNNKQRRKQSTTKTSKRRKTQTKIRKQTAKAKPNLTKKKINKENRIEDEEEEDEEIESIVDELGSSLEENFKVNDEEGQCGKIRKSQRRIEKLSKSTRKVTKKLVTKKNTNKDAQTKSSNTGSNKVAIAAASKNIACSFEGCSYVAKNQSVLKCHQVIHSPERPFKCDQCPQAFKYQCSLQAHQKIHFGIRYHCRFENCDANYSDERILRKHVAIVHTKSAPRFSCTWVGCQYNSCRMDLLRKHYKVHTGERPYACIWPGCEKTFKTLSSQHGHMLIHKNERQYKCTWPGCNYSCNLGGNLRKHEAIHEKKRS